MSRLNPHILSCNGSNYARFCESALAVIDTHLEAYEPSSLRADVRREAAGGVYCWAAASVHDLEGASPEFLRLLAEAERLTPDPDRVQRLRARAGDGIAMGHARLVVRSLRRRTLRWADRVPRPNSAATRAR